LRKGFLLALLVLVGGFVLLSVFSEDNTLSREAGLKSALAYLNAIPEVKWVEFERNTVHLGVEPLPDDIKLIAHAAAMNGEKAINFGVHVWVHPANDRNKYYGTATAARHGKISKPYGK